LAAFPVTSDTNKVQGRTLRSVAGTPASNETSFRYERQLKIDIISVGSLTKPEFQDAQQRTFGSLPMVRNFFRIDELNDADKYCPSVLTVKNVKDIVDFCSHDTAPTRTGKMLRGLFHPKRFPGWVCAQKRPIDGFHLAVQHWEEQARIQGTDIKDQLPTYLLIIDDDTWVNLQKLSKDIQKAYPPETPHAIAGYRIMVNQQSDFFFPYGGFGTILTEAALEKFLEPVRCTTNDSERDEFTRLACWRLDRNQIGEAWFFEEGMSIAELMYAFSSQQPFTQVSSWNEERGYCFHSDHALAYFISYYHIVAPEGALKPMAEPNDKIRRKYTFEELSGEWEGINENEHCKSTNRLCHYSTPEQMDFLHHELLLVEREGPEQEDHNQ
jgi:hypothetical protein